jgi:hypothetical protein
MSNLHKFSWMILNAGRCSELLSPAVPPLLHISTKIDSHPGDRILPAIYGCSGLVDVVTIDEMLKRRQLRPVSSVESLGIYLDRNCRKG